YRINRNHKDRLFCTVFGKERYKKYALDLYNAVNGSNYTDLSDLEIITLENVVYIKMKNDAAYLIGGNIALYEHQSSINRNMPIRGFIYLGELYSQILKRDKSKIYNETLVKIPTPQYIVFYNGEDEYPEVSKLKLSDAFINPRDDNEFEFTATVYNINLGKNKKLLDSCTPLKGYSIFVDRVRNYSKTMEPEQAIEKAVNECIEEGILKDVLERERSAVMLDILTTFDEKSYAEGLREEGREEGRKEEREPTERETVRADKAEAELEKCRSLLAKHGISYEE
ncbi:MAG: hypothetical protein IJ857_04105, partial [Lachnospiraceae bacterium]|nr:hypothetical protein [Lachnospiraceae bacterium]